MNKTYANAMVSFDKPKLARLKKYFEACPKGGTFMFEGKEYFKDYAKYLIQYLEGRFK